MNRSYSKKRHINLVNEALERVYVEKKSDRQRNIHNMKYDSKNSLTENHNRTLLLEYNVGKWCAKSNYNLGTAGLDYTFKNGSCFTAKSDSGPNAWAYSSNDPFESSDPLIFDCAKGAGSYLWEPDGVGNFWDYGLGWPNPKTKYYNNQLEADLRAHFCTTKDDSTWMSSSNISRYWNALFVQLNSGDYGNWQLATGAVKPDESSYFWSGSFVIRKKGTYFIEYWTGGVMKYWGNITSNKNKYAGENINATTLTTNLPDDLKGEATGDVTLRAFILNLKNLTSKDKEDDKEKKIGDGGKPSTTWEECSGTYHKGCKSSNGVIAKVQGCLGISTDGKFGSGTQSAVKAKINQTTFTDADVDKLCSKTSIGGGGSPTTGEETPKETPIDFS